MKIIGMVKPKPLSFYKVNAEVSLQVANYEYGDVESADINKNACKDFHRLLGESGYQLRDSRAWSEPVLVAVKGSVPPHIDNRLGLVAFWLLHKQPFCHKRESVKHQWMVDDPWLLSNQQRQRIRVGEVVVFDASATHAWICNGSTYAISQTISRKRKQ